MEIERPLPSSNKLGRHSMVLRPQSKQQRAQQLSHREQADAQGLEPLVEQTTGHRGAAATVPYGDKVELRARATGQLPCVG